MNAECHTDVTFSFVNGIAGAAEQVRQTRQLPDQCFDKQWYLPTSGGTERPPPWIHSYALRTRLEGKSVYESSCNAAKLVEVSGRIPGAC